MINTNVNAIMTIIGFAVSIMFIMFLCTRLLCARLHLRGPRRALHPSVLTDFGVLERGINGMEPIVVAMFPTVKYNHQNFASREDAVCTVCLGEYEERDVLRVLPNCGHVFHINCIDLWLRQHSTCPVCRVSLRDSCIGKSIPSPVSSMAAESRYIPGAVSEHLFEHSLNSSRELSSTISAQGQEQPVMPLISEGNQCGSVQHELDESTSERHMYRVTEDNCGGQELCSLQLNDTDSGGDQFASRIFAHNMRDERPRSHSLWLRKDFEEGHGAVENLEASYRKGSIPMQCDASKAMGISSSSQAQNRVNVASPDDIFEGSSWLSRFHMTLIASGVIVNAVSSSVSGRQGKDGIVSMEASGKSETLNRNSIPILIEGVRNVMDDNLSFCEITLEDRRSVAVDDMWTDGSSLAARACRDFADPHRILERNFIVASRETISDSAVGSLTSSSAEVHGDIPEKESLKEVQILGSFINAEVRENMDNREPVIDSNRD